MSGVLDGLPPFATTGVGSLPFGRPREAARHASRAYGLPFCPQLPRLDGDMLAEWLGADPGRCGWSADRDRERPAAWDAFLDEVTAGPPSHGLVKLQVTGPATLAVALERSAGRPGSGPGVAALAREVSAWVAANAAGQVRALGAIGLGAVVVADEPGLAEAGVGAEELDVWDPLRMIGAAWGLHVCGSVPWAVVDALVPDLISFDAAGRELDPAARSVLESLARRGGRIAWGVVDPVDPEPPLEAAGRLVALVTALAGRDPGVETIARQSLVTPGCGTGRLSAGRERLVASTLAAAGSATAAAVRALGREPVPAVDFR